MISARTDMARAPRPPSNATQLRRVRVLQVIDSLALGGAEQLVAILARYIDRTRYDLRVCSLTSVDETSPVVHDLRSQGITIYSLGHARRHHPLHVTELLELVRVNAIDVLHTHLGYSNTVGSLVGPIARRPVIATLHNAQRMYSLPDRTKQLMRAVALRLGSHTIIACAPEVRTEALQRLHLPSRKLVDVPNGIDMRVFDTLDPSHVQALRHELLGSSTGPLIVTVGNMRAAKGHEYLVEAAALALPALPGLRVVIVGQGRAYEPVVRARISALGLDAHVLLAGQRRDIAALLAAADLFVLPSVLEGLPLALLEAMAAGTPVVATAVGGVPRVVEDGVTGCLVPPADAPALARAMHTLLRQPALAAHLAAAGQARVRETYGADRWTARLQAIYDEAVQPRRRTLTPAPCAASLS